MKIKELLNNLSTKIKENKKVKYILIFVLIIALILVIFSDKLTNKSTVAENNDAVTYINNLQDNLQGIIEKIDGAGKTRVLINIESGMETVIAMKKTVKEEGNIIETEETPILVNGKTVTLREDYPKIVGAVIVCEGAKNISVVNSIINATTSLLNIDKNQIEILKMK